MWSVEYQGFQTPFVSEVKYRILSFLVRFKNEKALFTSCSGAIKKITSECFPQPLLFLFVCYILLLINNKNDH